MRIANICLTIGNQAPLKLWMLLSVSDSRSCPEIARAESGDLVGSFRSMNACTRAPIPCGSSSAFFLLSARRSNRSRARAVKAIGQQPIKKTSRSTPAARLRSGDTPAPLNLFCNLTINNCSASRNPADPVFGGRNCRRSAMPGQRTAEKTLNAPVVEGTKCRGKRHTAVSTANSHMHGIVEDCVNLLF